MIFLFIFARSNLGKKQHLFKEKPVFMTKKQIQPIFILLFGFFFFSCERGELLNSEADILEIILPEGMKVGEPFITNDEIRIPKIPQSTADSLILEEQLSSLIPTFILTPGATISDDGVPRDFSEKQIYRVTSEDKKYWKDYEITFFKSEFEIPTFSECRFDTASFRFSYYESFSDTKPYHRFFEVDSTNAKFYIWDSGNAGFAMTAGTAPAENYPTSVAPVGKVGTGARLVTRSTGGLGAMFGMPIAAGNLFLGYLNVGIATSRPLEATQFGIQTKIDKPVKIGLWAKYKAGAEYKNRAGNVLPITDTPEIYAVLYEPKKDERGNPVRLDGTNIKTADNIVLIAGTTAELVEKIKVDDIDAAEYIYMEIPFEARKEFELSKQENGDYYITIVFSSSTRGDLFEGAVGSTLCVDEVTFITE